MAAGASFIVAPGFDPEVCKHVIDKGGIMMPGTCSAGEMQQAMNMGCEALKFFPAEANGGVGMLKNIGAALKSARWMCTGGVNAKQIGLGTTAAATKVSITSAGASETTGNPFDIRLTDKNSTNFFIVNNGSENVFTRSGSFYVDGSGNLCMSSTGYTVMGWQVDPDNPNQIKKDTVSALYPESEDNKVSSPQMTTDAHLTGNIDMTDPELTSVDGRAISVSIYDALGYNYKDYNNYHSYFHTYHLSYTFSNIPFIYYIL